MTPASRHLRALLFRSILVGAWLAPAAMAGDWSGYIAAEVAAFDRDGLSDEQHNTYTSLAFEPEYYHEWKGGKRSFTFVPYLRLDQHDSERSHFDIREFNWFAANHVWEIRVGIGKVFWGVTEAVHLVDIINQTDLVENTDGEDKLGQPMVNLSLVKDWGVVDLFVLPGFRERTFPGIEGRSRMPVPIDQDNASYASSAEETHVDFALRWSHSIGDWDIGAAHFSGTSREPTLIPIFDTAGRMRLTPHYETIDQTSVDLQATKGSWLWKLEAYSRSGQGDRYAAAAAGFEYTLVGIRESALDLGIVAEYLYDERGEKATTAFQRDLFTGARLTFNDMQSTEILAGVINDLQGSSGAYNIEASRRFGNSWKLSLEARGSYNTEPEDLLYNVRTDDSLRVEIARHF